MSWEEIWLNRVLWLCAIFVGLSLAVFITDMVYDKFKGGPR